MAARRARSFALRAFVCALGVWSCSRQRAEHHAPAAATQSVESALPAIEGAASSPSPPLVILQVPRPEDALPPPIADGLLPAAPPAVRARCPPEMVDVRGEFCIDRYEASLVDARTGDALSPHYHPTRAETVRSYQHYRALVHGSELAVPTPPAFQLAGDPEPAARSIAGVLPQGYLSRDIAERACHAVGKRLCTSAEWVTACRGERNQKYPYGDQYRDGACNVFREAHPAAVLHGDASREHLDPRLGLVSGANGPLLRRTGVTPSCRSAWGDDAAFDMVGNLDEWVADGGFLGGFFSRATREGCDARVSSHPPEYFDYSLGARCCR